MRARRLVRLIPLVVPVILAGLHFGLLPVDVPAGFDAAPSRPLIGAPRQSLPVPSHDEATCAFCQAAAFTPCGAAEPNAFPLASAVELHEVLALEVRFTHSGSARPPRSRAPPVLQAA